MWAGSRGGVGVEFVAQLGELVFVVGPAVDGGCGFLVEQADLGLEVGDLALGAGERGLGFVEGRQVGAEAAARTAVVRAPW